MGYDRGDSLLFDFVSNGILFGSKSKGKLLPRSYPIQCERKWKHSFFSAWALIPNWETNLGFPRGSIFSAKYEAN